MNERLFKFLAEDGSSVNGGHGQYDLPTKNADGTWTPGAWREIKGKLKARENGLHLAPIDRLFHLAGPALFEAEFDPTTEPLRNGYEVVARRVRLLRRIEHWNERAKVSFSLECLERVAPIYGFARDGDDRIERVVDAVRAWVAGTATPDDLERAWDAACGAQELVDGSARRTVDTAVYILKDILGRNTRYRYASAVSSSADAVMGIREREEFIVWQRERLLAYLEGRRP